MIKMMGEDLSNPNSKDKLERFRFSKEILDYLNRLQNNFLKTYDASNKTNEIYSLIVKHSVDLFVLHNVNYDL